MTAGAVLRPLTLVVGDEELLVSRVVSEVIREARHEDPEADVRDLPVSSVSPADVMNLLTPSLFGERRVLVLRDLQDIGKDLAAELTAYVQDPVPDICLVAVHSGAAKNKSLLDGLRQASGSNGPGAEVRVVNCPKVTKAAERSQFVTEELRRAGRRSTPDAVIALLDTVGTDLRELATACSQLVSDTEGLIDADTVGRYHRGRADASGFVIADLAVEGNAPAALEALRWALGTGLAPVLITSALAGNVRTIARVAEAGRASPYTLSRQLGMPAWKVERAQRWARSWGPGGLQQATSVVAEADAAVKGAGADAGYAVERAVLGVAAARSSR